MSNLSNKKSKRINSFFIFNKLILSFLAFLFLLSFYFSYTPNIKFNTSEFSLNHFNIIKNTGRNLNESLLVNFEEDGAKVILGFDKQNISEDEAVTLTWKINYKFSPRYKAFPNVQALFRNYKTGDEMDYFSTKDLQFQCVDQASISQPKSPNQNSDPNNIDPANGDCLEFKAEGFKVIRNLKTGIWDTWITLQYPKNVRVVNQWLLVGQTQEISHQTKEDSFDK